jgi:hypothetical protein
MKLKTKHVKKMTTQRRKPLPAKLHGHFIDEYRLIGRNNTFSRTSLQNLGQYSYRPENREGGQE